MSFTKQHNMIIISEINTNLQIEIKISNQTNNLQTSINLYFKQDKRSHSYKFQWLLRMQWDCLLGWWNRWQLVTKGDGFTNFIYKLIHLVRASDYRGPETQIPRFEKVSPRTRGLKNYSRPKGGATTGGVQQVHYAPGSH
jgi:hypothetical protein